MYPLQQHHHEAYWMGDAALRHAMKRERAQVDGTAAEPVASPLPMPQPEQAQPSGGRAETRPPVWGALARG